MAELCKPRMKIKKKDKAVKHKEINTKTKVDTVTIAEIPSTSSATIDDPTNNLPSFEELQTENVEETTNFEAISNVEAQLETAIEKENEVSETQEVVENNCDISKATLSASSVSANSSAIYLALQNDLRNLEITQESMPEYVASAPLIAEDEESNLTSSLEEEMLDETSQAVPQLKETVTHRKIGSRINIADQTYVQPLSDGQLKSLYRNRELESNECYIQHFVEVYRCHEFHEFYKLVAGYQKSRFELLNTIKRYEELQKEYYVKVERVWSKVNQTAKAKGKCRDGNTVVGSYDYSKVIYDSEVANEVKILLSAIQTNVNDTYALHAYEVELSKTQVESYLYNLISSSSILSGMPKNAPIQVYFPELRPAELLEHVDKLKTCISILFSFQRQPEKDKQFVADSRKWLTKLVALLQRIGTFEDHLFILNQVMRCPAGISSWAAYFIQIPPPGSNPGPYPIGGPFLDHVMTVMATLLLPVKAREEFLANLNQETSDVNNDCDNKWVLVDSEGEEDEDPKNCWLHLRENDLVSVLNQIPIGALFKHLLGVFTINDVDYYDSRYLTDQEMMRVFSAATQIIRLFREGFKTYSLSRYKQFTKRVSQFIRHLVINITDHLQTFLWLLGGNAPYVRSRLLVEYDQFFLRSTYSIFSSQRKGAWQFMAAMPYSTVSVEMLWKILWLLHNDYEEDLESIEHELSIDGWQKKLSDQHLHLKFEERLSSLPENEAYYLLTAFANMATSRGAQDRIFIETVCGEIFQISFVNDSSKELCFKWGRELLACLSGKHHFTISVLVKEVATNIDKLGKTAIYLFQELPIYLWQPPEEDLTLLTNWLKDYSPASNENQFAQIVLSQMNWGLELDKETLFLDIGIHRQIAIAIWESYQKHFATVKISYFYESIKQISSIAAALKSGISPEDVFQSWSWKMIRTLKIHVNDITPVLAKSLANEPPIPDLLQDLRFQSLRWNVREKHPFAIFVAFKLTNVGQGIAEICQNLDYLSSLMEKQCFEGAIDLLYLITPLFFNCGHFLWTNKVFISLIQNLLTCDLTYLKMAKSMVVSVFPGNYLQLIANMITNQFQMMEKMEWTFEVVGGFWVETLTSIPNWYKNEAVLYLLDTIFMATFTEGNELFISILDRKFQNEISHQGASNTLSSFFSWVTTGAGVPFTLIQKDVPQRFPWMAYTLLEMETRTDREVKLWRFILKEFSTNASSMPDVALKKAAGKEEIMAPPIHHLPIYRWGLIACDLNVDCPIAPLFWQKFFIYYLQRPVIASGAKVAGGVGQRFFTNMGDVFILKKMKQKLKTVIEHYEKLKITSMPKSAQDLNSVEESEYQLDQKEWDAYRSKEIFYDNLLRLFRAFSLWLEEPQLHEANLYLESFLIEYDPQRLNKIIVQQNKKPWLEFVQFKELLNCCLASSKIWQERSFNKKDWKRIVSETDIFEIYSSKGVEKMLNRLRSYEEPIAPPSLLPFNPVISPIPNELFESGKSIREGFTPYFSVLIDFAKTYANRLSNHATLDCFFLELFPQIYQNVETEVQISVACHKGQSSFNLSSDSGCLGPANFRLKFNEMKEIISAKNRVDQNRSDWQASIKESLQGPPQNLCCSAVFIENAISQLLNSYKSKLNAGEKYNASKIREVGLSCFYQLCGIVNNDSEIYPPTKQFLTACIDTLGQELVRNYGDQCDHIMQLILDCPRLVGLLSSHFFPSLSGTEIFTSLYQRAITIHKTHSVNLACMILSKFDFKNWLLVNDPSLKEKLSIFKSIELALTDFGVEIKDEMQMIAELYFQHLSTLLRHKFPDMYSNVLRLLIKGLKEENVCLMLWYHVLNALVFNENAFSSSSVNIFSPTLTELELVKICSSFAEVQDTFSLNQIEETLKLFGSELMIIRNSSKELLFKTLFDKCCRYIKPVMIFISIMYYCYVGCVKRAHVGGIIPSSVIFKMWECLEYSFAPWILPINKYSEMWFPWNCGHEPLADEIMIAFVNCTTYAVTNLYASTNILSLVIKFYSNFYAKSNIKEHVLRPMHTALLRLPWNSFWPDVSTIDLMIQVLNEGIEECLQCLSVIFLQISWPEVVRHVALSNESSLSKVVGNLLHLHVRLCLSSPEQLEMETTQRLLSASATYPWNILSTEVYANVVQSFKVNCDPRCVLKQDRDRVDLLSLLQIAAEFVPGTNAIYPSVIEKRKCYVNLKIFLLCKCATNSKDIGSRMECFKDVISDLVSLAEAVIATASETTFDESVAIITEIINVFNLTSIKRLQEIALKALQDWIKAHPTSVLLRDILFASSRSIVLPSYMSNITESVFESYFSIESDGESNSHWSKMETAMQVPKLIQESLVTECLANGAYFTLYALSDRMITASPNIYEEWKILQEIIKWLEQVKPTEENEFKLILLWWRLLTEVHRSTGIIETSSVTALLTSTSPHLNALGEDKSSQGLWSYLGLGKRSSLSVKMRFFVRVLNAFILKQACHFEFRSETQNAGSTFKNYKSNLTKQAEVADSVLQNTIVNKQYEIWKPLFDHVYMFICDASIQFKDYAQLMSMLVNELYPEMRSLRFMILKSN